VCGGFGGVEWVGGSSLVHCSFSVPLFFPRSGLRNLITARKALPLTRCSLAGPLRADGGSQGLAAGPYGLLNQPLHDAESHERNRLSFLGPPPHKPSALFPQILSCLPLRESVGPRRACDLTERRLREDIPFLSVQTSRYFPVILPPSRPAASTCHSERAPQQHAAPALPLHEALSRRRRAGRFLIPLQS